MYVFLGLYLEFTHVRDLLGCCQQIQLVKPPVMARCPFLARGFELSVVRTHVAASCSASCLAAVGCTASEGDEAAVVRCLPVNGHYDGDPDSGGSLLSSKGGSAAFPYMLEAPIQTCSECPLPAAGRCPFVARKLRAGQRLWMQGDVPTELCLVRDGLLALSSTEPSGTETLSTVRGPRALVGMDALHARPSPVSVEALTDATVCAADAATVQRWLGPSTPVLAMLNLALEELSRTARDLNFRSGPSLARVARFLLAYARLIDGGRQTPFSKQHVARILGMRAETLSRCLRQLVDDHLIVSGRHVAILETDRLHQVARCLA
jgi:CRP/FNR family cyclic AMP-dependent transcriptional regulator